MSSKKQPVDEARGRLQQKLSDVQTKTKQIQDAVEKISKEATINAIKVIELKSKTKFMKKFSKASQQLETCLNQLLVVSDAIASLADDDSEADSECCESNDDNKSCVSIATTTNAPSYDTVQTEDNSKKIRNLPTSNLNKHDSKENLFSSVSTPMENAFLKRTLDKDVVVEPFKWEPNAVYPVILTNIKSPWDFSIQLTNPENDIMEKLCVEFSKESENGYKGGINYLPPNNVFCCVKSPEDDAWYRGKIIQVFAEEDKCGDVDLDNVSVKVLFIDEGNTAVVSLSSLRPLDKKFSLIPSQSFHCILGGIQPIDALKKHINPTFDDCEKLWSQASTSWLKDTVKDKIVATYLSYPPKETYEPPHNLSKSTLVCDIYINYQEINFWSLNYNRPPIECNLSFMMVVKGLACTCPYFPSELNHQKSKPMLAAPKSNFEQADQCFTSALCHKTSLGATEIEKEILRDQNILKSDNHVNGKTSFPIKNKTLKEQKETPVCFKMNSLKQHKISPSNKEYENRNHTNIFKTPKHKRSTQEKINPHNDCSSGENKTNNLSVKSTNNLNGQPEPNVASKSDNTFQFGKEFSEKEFLNTENDFVKIVVSDVDNPGRFYIHVITPEVHLFDKMDIQLNEFYNSNYNIISAQKPPHPYCPKTAVVIQLKDSHWYRAVVLDNNKKGFYEVLCVDFGFVESANEKYVLPIVQQFCVLPMETVGCCLADVQPLPFSLTMQKKDVSYKVEEDCVMSKMNDYDKKPNGVWSEKSVVKLKSLILTGEPLMASLKSSNKNSEGLYEVYIYDTKGDKDIFINQCLVDDGLVTSNVLHRNAPQNTLQTDTGSISENSDEGMIKWDPMKEQFNSNKNAYSVDTDDPEVAILGFVNKGKKMCCNFFKYGDCYRGKGCHYLHVAPDDPKLNQTEVFSLDNIVDLPDIGEWVAITVTSIFDPTHFWVTFPYGLDLDGVPKTKTSGNLEALNALNKDMKEYYSHMKRNDKTDLVALAECELIASKFYEDDCWYRSKVLNYADGLVQVFFVDYGNTAVVKEQDTRKLSPAFLHLPFQAVECFLNDAMVSYENFTQPFESMQHENTLCEDTKLKQLIEKFQTLYADKVLMARVLSRYPNSIIVVDLYDTSTQPHTHVNEFIRKWEGIVPAKRKSSKLNLDRIKEEAEINYIPG